MRRVTLNEDGTSTYDRGEDKKAAQGNYVSFTIWEKKYHFSAWRNGDAFIEAHGGTSIGAFASTMINSALILRGPPRPALYDGLLLQLTKPESVPALVDGWRTVKADGISTLPMECFVTCNQFFVTSKNAAAFETRWADRESKLSECEGFVAFSMLRRDGQAKGRGIAALGTEEPTDMSTTIWQDRKSFDNWRNGSAFRQAHGSNPQSSDKKPERPPAPLWSQLLQPIFYEGTMVITGQDGA
jgi:heme-degrading monooxygenase HmoA